MRLALLSIALLVSSAAMAQNDSAKAPPGRADAALAKTGVYGVDTAHTQLLFTVNHLGFSEYTGQFTQPTGTLTFDRTAPANSKVTVTFPIDQVSTTVPALDAHLKSADFFDASQHPTATFTSTRIVVHGVDATIAGTLTLKGVTRPLTLQARFVGAGLGLKGDGKTNIGFRATGSIKRSDWGIGYDIPLVSDRVDLVVNAAFQQK